MNYKSAVNFYIYSFIVLYKYSKESKKFSYELKFENFFKKKTTKRALADHKKVTVHISFDH